eukprot:Hpha_TRINITY_DN15887_c1_g5::TRINITY_DN15887_c1_g5_i1::g.189706::m.189706/K14326/UPF1, RENT1; regulator of nonsense transcripts 1
MPPGPRKKGRGGRGGGLEYFENFVAHPGNDWGPGTAGLPPASGYMGDAAVDTGRFHPRLQTIRRLLEFGETEAAVDEFCACVDDGGQPDVDICHRIICAGLRSGILARETVEYMRAFRMRYPLRLLVQAFSGISQRFNSQTSSVERWLSDISEVLDFGVERGPPEAPTKEHAIRLRFITHFLRLVLLEFFEEATQCFERVFKGQVVWLEDLGLALLDLRASPSGGGRTSTVKFISTKRGETECAVPQTSPLMKGDSVLLTADPEAVYTTDLRDATTAEVIAACQPDLSGGRKRERWPAGFDEVEAEITSITPHLQVRISGAPAKFPIMQMGNVLWRLDKMANRVTFGRQMNALLSCCEPRPGPPPHPGQRKGGGFTDGAVCDAILSAGAFPGKARVKGANIEQLCAAKPTHYNEVRAARVIEEIKQIDGLNQSQRKAILLATQRRITLIHGPPGTGKTHTAVSIVQAWLEAGLSPVLCTSDSNTAVDNMVSGLAAAEIKVIRIGRPEAVRDDLNQFTLDFCTSDLPKQTPREVIYSKQQDELRKAQAVCATCSGSASEILERMFFPAVLLDEASQATEPSSLVPLMHGAQQVALVGDHKQLPPTILSSDAAAGGLSMSLFDRLHKAGVTAHLLDTQYRMHPALMKYPSREFYNGAVYSGVPAALREPVRGFRWPVLGVPCAFVPVAKGEEHSDGMSYSNQREADKLSQILQDLLDANPELTPSQIGIITPYKAQVRNLQKMLAKYRPPKPGQEESRRALEAQLAREGGGRQLPEVGDVGLEINSVDGFQGREKEVILVSAVRANTKGEVGFLSDKRRMNVSLTRAKRGLIVLGHPDTLRHDKECWNPWLLWAAQHGLFVGRPAGDPNASAELSRTDASCPVADVLKVGDVKLRVGHHALMHQEPEDDDDSWTCPKCKSINELEDGECLTCGGNRPPPKKKEEKKTELQTEVLPGAVCYEQAAETEQPQPVKTVRRQSAELTRVPPQPVRSTALRGRFDTAAQKAGIGEKKDDDNDDSPVEASPASNSEVNALPVAALPTASPPTAQQTLPPASNGGSLEPPPPTTAPTRER